MRNFCLMLVAGAVLILSAHAASPERQLLMEVTFPPQYEFAPHFDAGLVQKSLAAWNDRRLLLVGSGDPSTASQTDSLSAAAAQLRESDALRLAYQRAQWLREQLLALGFRRDNLQIGTSLEASAEADTSWGGVVKVYLLN